MLPSLPQNDRDTERRKLRIARARREYRWSYVYPKDVAVCAKVPKRDQFGLQYLASVMQVQVKMLANHQVANLTMQLDSQDGGTAVNGPAYAALSEISHGTGLFSTAGTLAGNLAADIRAHGLDDFESMFGVFSKPPIVGFVASDAKNQDLAFAWQRIAGANPMLLKRVVADDRDGRSLRCQLVPLPELMPGQAPRRLMQQATAMLQQAEAGTLDAEGAAMLRRLQPDVDGAKVHGVPMPDNFRVTEAHFQRALEGLCETATGDTYDKALREGRLFISDYKLIAPIVDVAEQHTHHHTAQEQHDHGGAPQATGPVLATRAVKGFKRDAARRSVPSGPDKHMYAPIALFAWLPANAERPGRLVPIAIQCNQDVDDVFTPQPDVDPTAPEAEQEAATSQLVAWKLARTCVQVADGTWHEMIAHLGYTHMLLEVTIVSARRSLYENHPVRVLLEPHFQYTLPLNDTAVHNLIAPGGQVDQMLGGSLADSLSVLKSGLQEFEPRVASPRREMLLRGVLDWRGLPEFPYRDDVLPVWDAIHEFVESYLRLYYGHDGDVCGDKEVQAWVAEMSADNGGRLHGLGDIDTFEELVELVSFIIFTASAQHGAVNFPQFPLMGYAPNLPGAGYAAPPNRHKADGTVHPELNPEGVRYADADWFDMLPPLRAAMMQFNVLYELAAVRINKLGQYPRFHFLDRRVGPLLSRFQKQLKDIEKATVDRDRTRLITYPYLRPSNIPASIHI